MSIKLLCLLFHVKSMDYTKYIFGLFSFDYCKNSRCSSVLKNVWDLRDVIKPTEINGTSHVL